MNVLIINPILYTPRLNGARVHKIATIKHTMIYNYALGFRELGHSVTLVASEEYRPTEQEQYDIDIVFLPNRAKKLIKRWPNGFPILGGLYSYLRKNRDSFDMIIVSEMFTQQALAAALIAPEKTIIWQEMDHHAPTFHEIPSKIWHNTIIRLLVRNRVTIVARSAPARMFAERYCNKVSPVIIDHGVNIHNFTVVTDKRKQFVAVANFFDYKRIDEIIDRFARFVKKYDNEYKLSLAGDGDMRPQLEQQVKNLGITDNVVFCGFLSHKELSRIVGESQAALVRTVKDLNMVSIPETLACATPILTNLTPLLAGYIAETGMGIAKADWTEDDMQTMVERNAEFVANCVKHHYELSSTYRAEQMIKILENVHENSADK